MKIALAQINPLVGDISANTATIIQAVQQAQAEGARVVVLPELALTGYPPEDLLLRPSLQLRVEKALAELLAACGDSYVVLGLPWQDGDKLYNAAFVLYQGEVIARYYKQALPTYQMFDEQRYFQAGADACVFDVDGVKMGVLICEDLWQSQPIAQAKQAGAQLIVAPNASPFAIGKVSERLSVLRTRVKESGLPIFYCNVVGGQDEFVFDGASCALNGSGELCAQAKLFESQLLLVDCVGSEPQPQALPAVLSEDAQTYQALVLAVRDYVNKNGFKSVLLGLSGGIDSALTLAIAADALGGERVSAVMMPYHYTADISVIDAEQQAKTMGVDFQIVPIAPAVSAFTDMLQGPLAKFAVSANDTTEQNLQARSRGVLLMGISNRSGALVLTTGNKSEVGVGYCTLYGDMAGGFAPLKDLLKLRVYALSRYRNTVSPVIPERVIERAPSAELAPGQTDQDNLPPYEVLDEIIERYVERDQSAQEIIQAGFAETDVLRVIRLVDLAEYKRRQGAIGPRVTERSFGRDRRYPITQRWQAGI